MSIILGIVADSFIDPIGLAWDIVGATDDLVELTTTHTTPSSIELSGDGTKIYVLDTSGATVYEWDLSTAYNVSTGSYNSVSKLLSSQASFPTQTYFKPDGTKMVMIGVTNDVFSMYRYTLSTAWDLSTLSYDSNTKDISFWVTSSYAMAFKPDGTKAYCNNDEFILQFSLSTAFDLTSLTYDSISFSVGTQELNPRGLKFRPNGKSFFITGPNSDSVWQYNMSTAWDLSTASYDSEYFVFSTTSPWGLEFKPDGTKMYMFDSVTKKIYTFSINN